MRTRVLATAIVIVLLAPSVAAHGADTFSFIMRNSTLQPDEAVVEVNETMIFHNVVDFNRTLTLDLDGDGESEWVCEAGPLDSEGSDDECYLWLEEGNWTAEEFVVEIWNNESEFWKSISISVNLHDDEQGGDGDEHDHSEGDHQHGEEANGDLESLLLSAVVLCFGAAALIWISHNVKGGEEE